MAINTNHWEVGSWIQTTYPHFNPTNSEHGNPDSNIFDSHVGDLKPFTQYHSTSWAHYDYLAVEPTLYAGANNVMNRPIVFYNTRDPAWA